MRSLGAPIVALCAFIILSVCGHSLHLFKSQQKHMIMPLLSQWEPQFLNVLTLGHRPLYDDYLMVWMIERMTAVHLQAPPKPEDLFASAMAVVKQRPKIEALYLFPCFVLALDLKRPDFCEPLLLTGMNVFPQSWLLPVVLGYMTAYRLNNTSKGAAFYLLASRKPGAPSYVGGLAQKLSQASAKNGQESPEESLNLLQQILESSGDPQMKELLRMSSPDKAQKERGEAGP